MFGLALLALAHAAAAAHPAARWTFQEESVAAGLPHAAEASIRDASGGRLVLRCALEDKPKLAVLFVPQAPIAAGASRLVQLTLDNSRAEMASWQFPGATAVVDDAPTVYIFASEMAAAKRIEIGLKDGARAVTGRFTGPGNDAMFRKVYAACAKPYAMPDPYAEVAARKAAEQSDQTDKHSKRAKKQKKRETDQ